MEKRIYDFYCRNKQCRAIICQTDGEFFYVENLIVEYKKLARRGVDLICPQCGKKTRWHKLKKNI